MHKRRYSDNQLVAAVQNCFTIRDVLRELGLSASGGGSSRQIQSDIKRLGLDVSHMLGRKFKAGKKTNVQKIPLEEILVENSSYNRGHLKQRLIKCEILKNYCSECGQKNEWYNKPLVMVIDHINGVNNDNRLENLRLLCPNCNSQQPTFTGKNAKKRKKVTYYCLDCGEKVKGKNRRCHKCANIKRAKIRKSPGGEIGETPLT